MLIIAPDRLRAMICAARRPHRNALLRLTAMIRCHQAASASRKWRSVAVRLALLISTSSVPKRASVASNSASTCASSETSAMTGSALPPRRSIDCATSVAAAASTSFTTTCAPSAPERSAIARPIPWAAPVTIATFCVRVCAILPPTMGSKIIEPFDTAPQRASLYCSGSMILHITLSDGQRQPVDAKPRDVVGGLAADGQIGQDAPDHAGELEAMSRAGRGHDHLGVRRVAIDDEVLVRRHGVAAAH